MHSQAIASRSKIEDFYEESSVHDGYEEEGARPLPLFRFVRIASRITAFWVC